MGRKFEPKNQDNGRYNRSERWTDFPDVVIGLLNRNGLVFLLILFTFFRYRQAQTRKLEMINQNKHRKHGYKHRFCLCYKSNDDILSKGPTIKENSLDKNFRTFEL